jgi:N-acetylmuramoyl-L-alanine amidase
MIKKRKIELIIIHCSDTPAKLDIGVHEIDDWHSRRPHFRASSNGKYCGYHWVIRRDGSLEMGRAEADIGAHCRGKNSNSIGVCVVGRGDNFTGDQWKALKWFIKDLLYSYNLTPKHVFGHYEFDSKKTCPEFNMNWFRTELEMEGESDGGFGQQIT